MVIERVGVVGCGLMGSGIAQVAAAAGYRTYVREVVDSFLHKGLARIRKGEFNSADYVLFVTLTAADFRDTLSPLQGSSSATHQFSLDMVADFSLINT